MSFFYFGGYYGHAMRKCNSFEKEVTRGCTSDSRSRDRQCRRWTDDISERSGMTISDAGRVAEDADLVETACFCVPATLRRPLLNYNNVYDIDTRLPMLRLRGAKTL